MNLEMQLIAAVENAQDTGVALQVAFTVILDYLRQLSPYPAPAPDPIPGSSETA